MNWGKWIVVAFVFFVMFIGTLVTVCVRQKISLVSKEYYQDDLNYQSQVRRIENTKLLNDKPVVSVLADQRLKIDFSSFPEMESGELTLYSPSNPDNDVHIKLSEINSTSQIIGLSKVPKGHYQAKIRWTMGGKEYYTEQYIFM